MNEWNARTLDKSKHIWGYVGTDMPENWFSLDGVDGDLMNVIWGVKNCVLTFLYNPTNVTKQFPCNIQYWS